jgi:uncharacterized protein
VAALGRHAHRIVWANPRAAAPGFAPLAGGMAAALPHLDSFVSGHSADALVEVVRALGLTSGREERYRPIHGLSSQLSATS